MPKISLFNSISEVKNPQNIDLIIFLEDIRDGVYWDIVKKCRDIDDHDARKAYKETMPTATFSGVFERRADGGIIEPSGFLAMDADELGDRLIPLKGQLQRDPYVFACFLSVGGNGLRIIFRIDPKKHNESFRGLMEYLNRSYGLICDPNSSLSKPYIVSHDPLLFMQTDIDDVPIFKKYPKEVPVKKIADFVHTDDDFMNVLKQISLRGLDIAPDYLDYIKVGFAIASKYGENGREYFHEVSRHNITYDVKKCDKQYNYLLRDSGREKANIATFYYFAKTAGINIVSENTKTIIRTTKTGRKAGLTKEQIAKNLEKFNNLPNTINIVTQIYDAHDEINDEQESILHELEMYISNNYNLEKNEVSGFIENHRKQLTPDDLNSIFISSKKVIPTVDYQLMKRLLNSEFIKVYNPFFEFFDSDGIPVILPPVPDGANQKIQTPLIDLFGKTIQNEDPSYTLFFVKKWLVSIISSAHKVHSPLLLCLLGGQNTGKTEWFRRLLPTELQAYYAESKLDKEKDDELLMTENLVIMDDELGGKSKQDNLKLKNITSKQWFSIRRPYGDHNEKILRLAVLCGTSNTLNILSDSTGNRRIIPIEVTNIDKELYNSINKKELFMEIFKLYKSGFDWRITAENVEYLNKDEEKFQMIISERELIEKYYTPTDKTRMSTTDIKVELEILTHQKLNVTVIGRELTRAGFNLITTRQGTKSTKKWGVMKINRGSDLVDQTELQKNTF